MLTLSSKPEMPKQMVSKYSYAPVKEKIVVDLFFDNSCSISEIEAYRVMRVVEEFGGDVILNTHEIEEQGSQGRIRIATSDFYQWEGDILGI